MPNNPTLQHIARNATRLLLGAHTLKKANGDVELTFCGAINNISGYQFDQVENLVKTSGKHFLETYSYAPPFDAEAIIRAQEYFENILSKSFDSTKLKVIFFQNGDTGCGYWRCSEPARMLMKKYGGTIYAEATEELNFNLFESFDVIVVQRGLYMQYNSLVQSYIDKLKLAGKCIIYETDDDMDNIFPSNTATAIMSPDQREFIAWLRRESDAVFVTTERLKTLVGYPEKTYTLPNSIDIGNLRFPVREEWRNEFVNVLYHGGANHNVDFEWFDTEFLKLIRDRHQDIQRKINKKLVYSFMGYFPEVIENFMDQKYLVPGYNPKLSDTPVLGGDIILMPKRFSNIRLLKDIKNVSQFHQGLVDIQPDICICPLNPNVAFNAGKSIIKFLESTLAGAACVVTNYGPYKDIPDECAIKAKTPSQFTQGIRELIESPEKRQSYHQNALQWVKENYDLSSVVDQWKDTLFEVYENFKEKKLNG